jgi:hypothetical protein
MVRDKFNILFIIILLATTRISFACDCDSISIDTAWDYSEVVFIGTVTSKLDSSEIIFQDKKLGYTILVINEVFKGNSLLSSKTLIFNYYTSCDFEFEVGQSYLIYGEFPPECRFVQVNKCSRIIKINEAQKEIEYINEVLLLKDCIQYEKVIDLKKK